MSWRKKVISLIRLEEGFEKVKASDLTKVRR